VRTPGVDLWHLRVETQPLHVAKERVDLSAKQAERLTWLTRPSMRLKTTRAARWRDDFNGF